MIVSPDGYILTNNHVVKDASEIRVALADGREFPGKVVGTDPKTDVAVIKIKANDLPAMTFADSQETSVGDVVLAIGNPFGIGQTVTEGIVSAKDRVTDGGMDEDFIQTDAAINPGNSGGALVDVEGRLVGINTAILSHSGGSQGVGFAIPSNLCEWVMTSLVKNGRVERGFLGVNIQNITPALGAGLQARPHQRRVGRGCHLGWASRSGRLQERRRDPAVQRPRHQGCQPTQAPGGRDGSGQQG